MWNLEGMTVTAKYMGEYMNMNDAYSMYEDMLDEEGPVYIGGMVFYRSNILKNCDPVAYQCGFNDYMDAIGIDTDTLED